MESVADVHIVRVDEPDMSDERSTAREGGPRQERGLFAKCLGAFGLEVAKRPIFVIFLMTLLTCLAAVGFVRIQIISDGIKLWVPQKSKAMFDRKAVTTMFDTHNNFVYVNIEAVDESQGILYSQAFEESIRLHKMMSSEVVDSRGKSYADLCLRIGSLDSCYFSGSKYLDLSSSNLTLFQSNIEQEIENELSSVISKAQTDVTFTLRNMKSCGTPHRKVKIIGDEEKEVVDCKVLKLGYAIGDEIEASLVEEWFASAEIAVAKFNKEAKYTKGYVWHRLSLDQAIQETVIGDLHLMVTCFVLMVSTSIVMLIKFRVDPSKPLHLRYFVDWKSSRIMLGCIAVLSVAFSIVGGYGIAVGVCGVEFNTLCAILPFILVGIGVDDAFVLVCGLDRAVEALSCDPESKKTSKEEACERISETMATVGPTVTATSLTNIIAFLLGSITAIPALRSFCIYAGICILCDYIMQVTFFLAAMTLFERKQVAQMMEKRAQSKGGATGKERKAKEIYSVFDLIGWFFSKTLAPLCTRGVAFRALVVASAVGFTVISVHGVMNIQQGLPLKDLTTIGSNLYTYFELEENSFENQVGPETALYLITREETCQKSGGIDMASPTYQNKLLKTHDHIMLQSSYIKFKQATWLEQLIVYAGEKNATSGGTVREEQFYDILASFLREEAYSDFSNDVLLVESPCDPRKLEVQSSRFHYSHAPTGKDYGIRKKALREIRQLERDCQEMYWKDEGGRAKIFLYGLEYLFWEQDAVLLKECLLSLGLAVAGVFIVSVVIIGFHLIPILVIVSAITLVDLYLFGFLYMLGLRFNAVTVVNLVMAVGLSIDYSLHMAHSCLETGGNGRNSIERALTTIGPAVLAGGISTFMGIIPLAGSTTFIFKMFFKLMAGTVLFGQFVSLLLLPTLLSFSSKCMSSSRDGVGRPCCLAKGRSS